MIAQPKEPAKQIACRIFEKAQEPHIAFLPEHLAAILETAVEKAKARVGAKEGVE